MSIIRIQHSENYVVLNKAAFEDMRLTLKAKGLWAYCMSKPNDWKFYVSQMTTCLKEGKDAIYSGLNELIQYGYCERRKIREKGKLMGVEYILYESPEFKKSLPRRDFPYAENPDPENPQLPSNNKQPSIDKKNPPTPPKTEVPKDKKYWRGLFSEWKEEEFEFAWGEYEKAPKGSVKSIKAWLPVPRQRYLEKSQEIKQEATNKKEDEARYKRHHKQAQEYAGKEWRGFKVRVASECVHFSNQKGGFSVGYGVQEADWMMQTGWKPHKA